MHQGVRWIGEDSEVGETIGAHPAIPTVREAIIDGAGDANCGSLGKGTRVGVTLA
jgi:hypothetical protein